ncbi:hypothetical protein EKN56_11700 [Limnobaculum zhutongyuii]|uniref:Uncharacterized protein n=1 Tax=Limnobaculum zhutongyuii TaxID=2498113 RepID=A0A411WLE8_9GAMM|nr:hypothetical protein [Limnobaculum zhutongyuii]QBH97002.1 hypothetical protein EKN56_11700 [Limnobaculum zhutongyuii]TQS87448.1 hypothetical protein ELQ32_14110 [Limnobaculum zhutongyuii]
MKYLLMIILGLCFTGSALAGCAEDENARCSYYKAGELKSQSSCKITTCAATEVYFLSQWEWSNGNSVDIHMDPETKKVTLNDKPTYSLPQELSGKMTCFGVVDSDELMCTDSGNF